MQEEPILPDNDLSWLNEDITISDREQEPCHNSARQPADNVRSRGKGKVISLEGQTSSGKDNDDNETREAARTWQE